jgi:hypothetical protein
MTVQRLNWDWVVRLHRYLEFFGKLATAVWVGFVVSLSSASTGRGWWSRP